MIHPSYYELMEKINEGSEMDDAPVITSRYSIVLATSKRARQLTDGAEPKVRCTSAKLLSVAIEELYEGAVNIVPEEEAQEDAAELEAEEASEAAVETAQESDRETEEALSEEMTEALPEGMEEPEGETA